MRPWPVAPGIVDRRVGPGRSASKPDRLGVIQRRFPPKASSSFASAHPLAGDSAVGCPGIVDPIPCTNLDGGPDSSTSLPGLGDGQVLAKMVVVDEDGRPSPPGRGRCGDPCRSCRSARRDRGSASRAVEGMVSSSIPPLVDQAGDQGRPAGLVRGAQAGRRCRRGSIRRRGGCRASGGRPGTWPSRRRRGGGLARRG